MPLELNQASDYAGGDFNGGNMAECSLACKTFDSLTRTHPYEFMTCAERGDEYNFNLVSLKPKDELRMTSLVPTLHSAPFLVYDGFLPDGTLYKPFYEVFTKMNALLAQYDPFLGGDLLADVAIYYDKESMYDPAEKGVRVSKLSVERKAVHRILHRDALFGIASILREAHIPFGVITNVTLEQLSRYRAVILPNVLELTGRSSGAVP